MSDISKFYDMASLSGASYVEFDKLPDFSKERIEGALQNPALNGRFSAIQAEEFVKHWEVVSHQANTDSGFSATLFQNKDTGEFVYACRGTEGVDYDDLFSADGGDIVNDGLAIKQIVDMRNDVLRLRTPSGQTYQAYKLDVLGYETGLLMAERALNLPFVGPVELALRERTDIVIDGPGPFVKVCTVSREDSATLYGSSDLRATGAGVQAMPITITGHSLGGHLAAAYTRLFPALDAQAYTFNGAGFAVNTPMGNRQINIRNLFSMLGGTTGFDEADILNLFGSKGPEFTTMDIYMGLEQQGAHKEIFIEDWNLTNVLGHGAVQMTDAMAIYDLFFRIDERFCTGELGAVLAELKPLFEAASNDKYGSFESVVNVIGGQLVPDYVPIQKSEWGDREKLYSKILAIQEAVEGKNLHVTSLVSLTAGQLKIQAMSADDLGLATRYALVNLCPFIFGGEAGLYSRFNTKGELDLINPTTGQGLSEQYLEDRAKFLALKNELAVADRPWQETIPSDMHGYYEDRGSQFSINNTYNATRVPAAEYIFGTDNADVIESFRDPRVPDISFNDHMFGGGGNDIIRTHAGNDYLEGGSGQDSMDGGAGDDIFYIQGTDTDYDVFRGGPDTDKILGSKGNDTIRVHRFTGEDTVEVIDGGDGFDVIAGTDGEDLIDLTGTSLDGIERIEGGLDDDTILGSMGNDTIHGGEGDDVITGHKGDDLLVGGPGRDVCVYAEGDGHDTIVDSGDNLIQLRLADGSIVPVGDFFAKGASTWESADGRMRLVHNTTWKILMPGGGSIDLGAGFKDGDYGIRLLNPSSTNQTLTGTAYRDEMGVIIHGTNRADWELGFWSGSLVLHRQQLPSTAPRMHITGGGGGDFLIGFRSRDVILGGDGGDIIIGNSITWNGKALSVGGPLEGDYLDGGAGGDFIFGSGGADQIFGDAGDDYLEGLNDNDLLDGGTGTDVLAGGSGADILLGGDGDDILTGDGYLQLNTSLSLDNLHQFGVTVTPSAEGYHIGFNTAWLMCTGHQLPL